tara:strand:- start:1265 stop:1558 length:294 start_codon:yes stop_codon:yes gene_type:complete
MSITLSSKVDISQKKLYEKLTLLEKYCIKLEKRVSELENCGETQSKTSKKNTKIKTKLTSDQIIQSTKTNISTNTKNINPSKKAKKIFDKYNMNRKN